MKRYDPLTLEQRSERMSRVKSGNTKPEMVVRRLVYGMGYRYRLHGKELPGRPDLVFRRVRKAVFVHGCFWHQHGCGCYRMPKTRVAFWRRKLLANKLRDVRAMEALTALGWRCLVIWECELRRQSHVRLRIRRFLEG